MNKIRKNTLIFAILLFFSSEYFAQQFYFDGVYSGKKMIVNNPLSVDFFGTCIRRISINGEVYPFNISDNYLELDIARVNVRKGELFSLLIEHEVGCQPFIYNKKDFTLKEIIKISNLKFENNKLSWNIQDNMLLSPFILELQFQNKWLKIAEIPSENLGNQSYQYELPFVLSGKNSVRLSKQNTENSTVYFPTKENANQAICLETSYVEKKIAFLKNNAPCVTVYQLNDSNGVTVKSGFGKNIDVTNLKSGFYTLYYDNKKETIVKK